MTYIPETGTIPVRKIVVHFKGGPLGGTTRELSRSEAPGGMFRVQVPAHIEIGRDYSAADVPTVYETVVEEYELRPSASARYGEYDGIWRHPQSKILMENRRLRKQVTELQQARNALEALKTLQTYLNNGF